MYFFIYKKQIKTYNLRWLVCDIIHYVDLNLLLLYLGLCLSGR